MRSRCFFKLVLDADKFAMSMAFYLTEGEDKKHLPASITKTLSQSMTVGILWAMLIIVQAAKSSRMIF